MDRHKGVHFVSSLAMVNLDYMYGTGWSMSWDIKLMLQTVPAVLEKRGAY